MSKRSVSRAGYSSTVEGFIASDDDAVLGSLVVQSDFDVDLSQRNAWIAEIQILRSALVGIQGTVLLEFDIPRLGGRIDAVVISGAAILVIEFKVGERRFNPADRNQVWDYALDLKNFHLASHHAIIIPILVSTEAVDGYGEPGEPSTDGVYSPFHSSSHTLSDLLLRCIDLARDSPSIDPEAWVDAPYHPTPTIIEAARALYSRHTVDAITRHDAGAKNLATTSNRVEVIIDEARQHKHKSLVFVTGVPGAGKTLVGLNVATKNRDEGSALHSVFLSGNGPLVEVLRAALVRDEKSRAHSNSLVHRDGDLLRPIKSFIQHVHHFRDDGIKTINAPLDHVVIFDEAQRAWNQRKTATFMKARKGIDGFDQSEPAFLLSYLDRHKDWAVVICLVGGGQEIHQGEAGIAAWLDAVADSGTPWRVFISPHLSDSEYAAVEAIDRLPVQSRIVRDHDLHLSVSMRSFRAEKVSQFVKSLLDIEVQAATDVLAEILPRFPIVVTRDLNSAKSWINKMARGSERFGLLASSGAYRLKPYAVDVRVAVNPVHWFLNERDDIRSSYFMEDAATEFQVQGLELDWACVTWDADLRLKNSAWSHNSFRGDRWEKIHKPDRQAFLRNAYRVLLTRARQGMVVWVPSGSELDATRPPEFYNETFNYLSGLGIPVL